MGITVLLDFYNYIIERFNLRIYIPLGLILWGMISFSNNHYNYIQIPILILLLFFYRLIDDISDLPKDTKLFPERVLVKTKNISVFFIALAILHGLFNIYFYHTHVHALYGFNIYTFFLSSICISLRFKTKLELIPTLASLTKYSVLILIFAHKAWQYALGTFIFFIFYEWWHNRN